MEKKKIKYSKNWTFKSKNIAENFDNHVKQSVPLYEETQRMVTEISTFYLRKNDCLIDLGCSTGTMILKINQAINKDIDFIAIDDSKEMIEICKKNLEKIKTHLINQDIESYDFLNIQKPLSVVTSLYCMQFLNVELRKDIIRKIYQKLRLGGAFILVEKIRSEHSFFNEMQIDLYHDMKMRNGLSPADNVKKSKSLRGVMNPVSIDENRGLLLQAGFSKIDIFFKWHNFVGFIAEK